MHQTKLSYEEYRRLKEAHAAEDEMNDEMDDEPTADEEPDKPTGEPLGYDDPDELAAWMANPTAEVTLSQPSSTPSETPGFNDPEVLAAFLANPTVDPYTGQPIPVQPLSTAGETPGFDDPAAMAAFLANPTVDPYTGQPIANVNTPTPTTPAATPAEPVPVASEPVSTVPLTPKQKLQANLAEPGVNAVPQLAILAAANRYKKRQQAKQTGEPMTRKTFTPVPRAQPVKPPPTLTRPVTVNPAARAAGSRFTASMSYDEYRHLREASYDEDLQYDDQDVSEFSTPTEPFPMDVMIDEMPDEPMYAASGNVASDASGPAADEDPEDWQAREDLKEVAQIYGLKFGGVKGKDGVVRVGLAKKGLLGGFNETFDDNVSALAWVKENMQKIARR